MAGYGLDDDDFDEFLESSDDEVVVVGPAAAPAAAVPPKLQWVLAATSFQGPVEGGTGDACRLVPPNRSAGACTASCSVMTSQCRLLSCT